MRSEIVQGRLSSRMPGNRRGGWETLPCDWMDVPSRERPAFAGMTRGCNRSINIERVNAKLYILLGGLVGSCVAIGFAAVLWFQFDAAGTEVVVIASLPICAAIGAGIGWAWWRILGRW